MVSSNMALRWVPYPTQVVGKSAKPIPVMLLGVLIGRKSYSLQRYFFVLLIVVGVVLFMMKDSKASQGPATDSVGIGEVLLFLSLAMDGLTGAIQERMRAASSPSAQHMMLSMNSWSTGILFVGLVLSGELFEFIYFAGKYPYVLLQLASLAVTGALGQLFIFMMVNHALINQTIWNRELIWLSISNDRFQPMDHWHVRLLQQPENSSPFYVRCCSLEMHWLPDSGWGQWSFSPVCLPILCSARVHQRSQLPRKLKIENLFHKFNEIGHNRNIRLSFASF